jgi:hypothetical protein
MEINCQVVVANGNEVREKEIAISSENNKT